MIGQKAADGQHGTNKVPAALQALACFIVLGIKHTGGLHQFRTPYQLKQKAFTPLELGQ